MNRIPPSRDLVVLVVAVGLATAMNCFTFAVLYDAIFSQGPGLSENAAQVLTGWGGGMIGLIGAYVGARASTHGRGTPDDRTDRPDDTGS